MDESNLEDIARVVGYTATRQLAAWYSGRSIYVPRSARYDHPLARLIGMAALRALVDEFACLQLTIPTEAEDDRWRRDRRVATMLVAGQTPQAIAREIGLTTRRVEQIRADLVDRGLLQYAAATRRGAPVRETVAVD